jgi:hypothetical protein
MQKSELIEIIREVVKAELRVIGPTLVREALLESLSGEKQPLTESTKPSRVVGIQEVRKAPQAPSQPKEKKKYSTNPILNDILNETSGGIPTEQQVLASAPDLTAHIPEKMLTENTEVQGVVKALGRDYRALIRAADEKAKKNRP